MRLSAGQIEGVTIHYAARIEDVLAVCFAEDSSGEVLDEEVREEVIHAGVWRFELIFEDAVRLFAGPHFFCAWRRSVFQGVLRNGVFCCGVFVVKLWWIAW